MREEIQAVIDRLQPSFRAEGAELKLEEIMEDGTVKIRMLGVCRTCTAALWTHRLRVERAIHESAPGVRIMMLLG